MGYGKKITLVCANPECGKTWESLKSQARQCCSKECSEVVRKARITSTKNKEEVKEKARETRLAKWGAWNSSEIMQRSVEARKQANGGSYFTSEERARMSVIQKSLRTKESRQSSAKLVNRSAMVEASRKTRNERYGTWSPLEALEKARATKIARHGKEHPEEFVEARKLTMVERYGVEHALQIPGKASEAQTKIDKVSRTEKQKQTCMSRIGVENPMQDPTIAARSAHARAARRGKIYTDILEKEWWDLEYKERGESLGGLSAKFGVSVSHLGLVAKSLGYPITNPITTSQIEKSFADSIEALGVKVVRNTKGVITPKELDIFLPDYNLAIEVNGIYWHSEEAGGKPRGYHREKMLRCEEQGIRLIQFWDTELSESPDICLGIIRSALSQNVRIPARKCRVVEVPSEIAKGFMESNHLAGFRGGSHIGLDYNGKLVAVMTVGASHFRRDAQEIKRFATLIGHNVIGGFSRLLARLTGKIVSYSDNRYSQGNVYLKTGFTLERDGEPTPWYTKDAIRLHHRSVIIEKERNGLTQRESARLNGWLTVWDAGQRTWILDRH